MKNYSVNQLLYFQGRKEERKKGRKEGRKEGKKDTVVSIYQRNKVKQEETLTQVPTQLYL